MRAFIKDLGIQFRRIDAVYFLIGMIMPVVLLSFIFIIFKSNGTIGNTDFWLLLSDGKKKLVYYLGVGFIEELLFRGLLFGFVLRKIQSMPIRMLLSAIIFSIPHSINTTAPVYIMVLFSFLFGVLACEMLYYTGSLWLSTGFHWIWNYTIVHIFLVTDTNQFLSSWIIGEMLVLIPLAWYFFGRLNHHRCESA